MMAEIAPRSEEAPVPPYQDFRCDVGLSGARRVLPSFASSTHTHVTKRVLRLHTRGAARTRPTVYTTSSCG